MVKLFFHSVKIFLIAVAIGALGSHFLLSPLSEPAKIVAISIILVSLLAEVFSLQFKGSKSET